MNNYSRIFESVVAVDAWRTSFDAGTGRSAVHVDVSFLRAKLGDEPSSPIRFELVLKRAEVRFIIPSNEPIKVVRSSVKRETPIVKKIETLSEKTVSAEAKARLAANLNSAPDLNVAVGGTNKIEHKESVTHEREVASATWAQIRKSDGSYCWEFAPQHAKHLLGKVWDAVSEPILHIEEITKSKLAPACRVEITCRREDLSIPAITVKDGSSSFTNLVDRLLGPKLAAIEAYIKNALTSRDLDIKNFEDPYGTILLADVPVEEGS